HRDGGDRSDGDSITGGVPGEVPHGSDSLGRSVQSEEAHGASAHVRDRGAHRGSGDGVIYFGRGAIPQRSGPHLRFGVLPKCRGVAPCKSSVVTFVRTK